LLLQRLVFVIKFIAERGLAFRDDENVGSPRIFSSKYSKNRCDTSGDRFCNGFTNRWSLSNIILHH